MRCSMATNYPEESLRMLGLNRGRGVPTFICNDRGLIVPEKVAVKADAMLVEDYYPEQSPLGEAFGCGDDGLAVYRDDEIVERDQMLFGFDDEDEHGRELAEIATRILNAYDQDGTSEASEDDDDVGMVVTVASSDAQDYGTMVIEILSATSVAELQEIVDVYAEDLPDFARNLAKICAQRYPNGAALRFAS